MKTVRDACTLQESALSIKLSDQIEQLAYRLWEERGCPDGSPEEDWFQAKRRLRYQSQVLSGLFGQAQLPFSSIRMGY